MNFKSWYTQKFASSCELVADYFSDYIAISASEIGVDWQKIKNSIAFNGSKFIAKKQHLLANCKHEVAIYASCETKYSIVNYPVITMINKGGAGEKIVISLISILWQEYERETQNKKFDTAFSEKKLKIINEKQKIAKEKMQVEEKEKFENVTRELWEFETLIPVTNTEYTKRKKINTARLIQYIDIRQSFNDEFITFKIQNKKEFVGVQRIHNNGDKKFTYGMKKKSGFALIGNPEPNKKIYFVEGFATGCSIAEAYNYNHAVVVCLDIYNMYFVLQSLITKKLRDSCELIICADNDAKKENNVGLDKAKEYSKEFEIQLKYPKFGNILVEKNCSDFNDLHVNCGIQAVISQLET